MSDKYGAEQIVEMSELDHIRKNSSMYIGNTETATSLLFEVFDNAVDEALAGYADKIGVFINTQTGVISVLDSGRGYPFNQSLPIEKDPPVLTCTKLFTSGKFKKNENDSAYKIAAGLHGIGNVAVYALSDYMKIEIYRDGLHALYHFEGKKITRIQETFEGKKPFSTKVEFKPSKKYFFSTEVNMKAIEERIRLVVANHPNVAVVFRVDGKDKVIKGTEEELIADYLSKTVDKWFTLDIKNRKGESCHLRIGWEKEGYGTPKIISSVNLVRTDGGVHVNKLFNIIRPLFQALAKKRSLHFENDDCMQGLRAYISLEIIDTSFSAQVKTTLEKNADISIMDNLEKELKSILEEDEEFLTLLLSKFQTYRQSIQSSKINKNRGNAKKRSITKFTKLKDCIQTGGELLIGEGDSAINGISKLRDKLKHAMLPLRGVIPNALTKKRDELLKNEEVLEIIQALGCGIESQCDISKLRYDKIIICTDSDPAGHWIASLLIILFAKLTPDMIKNGHLYICKTPLYGVHRDKKFVPLWTSKELDDARNNKEKIKRFKGLGEFNPPELKVFMLDDETRILIPVKWSENHHEELFELFTSSERKRELVSGKWKLKDE
jgi:DNA gyrase subunit B